jgi:transcriptional regulator with XRE-family HTH domain
VLIRKLRLQRGWSQEQLAELTGLSVRTIQRVERGYPPSLETRNALAAVFGIDLSQLDSKEQTMTTTPTPEDDSLKKDEARALEYVQGIKAFYQHVFFYVFFMLLFCGGIFMVHGFIPVYIQFTVVS